MNRNKNIQLWIQPKLKKWFKAHYLRSMATQMERYIRVQKKISDTGSISMEELIVLFGEFEIE